MAPTPEQAQLVADLKAGILNVSIPIISRADNEIGNLAPVTRQLAEDPSVIDAVYRWRRAHMTAFLTVFTPTLEKTRTYLTRFSLADTARVLFLVADTDKRRVGHIGLCNIAANGAEIDNVIRGESVALPDFMVCAHVALLHWAFRTLRIPLAYLNVLSNNSRAIRTYQTVGLRSIHHVPLTREKIEGGGYRLLPATAPDDSTELTLVRMEISREAFLAKDREKDVTIARP